MAKGKRGVSLKDKVENQLNLLLDDAMKGKLDFEKAAVIQQILKSAIDFLKLKADEEEGSFFKTIGKGENDEKEDDE